MGDIQVRQMMREDIPAILAIERVSFPTPWSAETFERTLENPSSACMVVEDETVLAGYLCASTVLDETDLQVIAVEPKLRRNGLARLLLLALLRHARSLDVQKIHLEVRRSNTAALKLYESLGFSEVGVRKGYYQSPAEDALLLTREMDRALDI
jgi:ribosomal-protein-alanine N-acetyltransferase